MSGGLEISNENESYFDVKKIILICSFWYFLYKKKTVDYFLRRMIFL